MERLYCDLHTHSNYSDGTYTPREIVIEAEERGLYAVALTDHNSVFGLREFLDEARGKEVIAVPGVEFSTDYGETEPHIIGMFVGEESYGKIIDYVAIMSERKKKSNEELIAKLIEKGYNIDKKKLTPKENGQINRAHIAHELMINGYVGSVDEAFDTILRKGGEFYTQPKRLDVFETIGFIKSIGAVAVLAHPFLNLDEGALREFLPRAIESGLDAMETRYSKYDEKTELLAREIATEFGILESGGSDFHGYRKPGIDMGVGRGNLAVGREIFLGLKDRKDQKI